MAAGFANDKFPSSRSIAKIFSVASSSEDRSHLQIEYGEKELPDLRCDLW